VFTQDRLLDQEGHQGDQDQETIQDLRGGTLGHQEDVLDHQEDTQGHQEGI